MKEKDLANLKDKDKIEGDYVKLDGSAPDLEGKLIGHALQKKEEEGKNMGDTVKDVVGTVGKFATQGIGSIIKSLLMAGM